MSLRAFHLFFIILCIMGADLIGVLALRMHSETGSTAMLATGILTIAGGLGLIGYFAHIAKLLDRFKLQH